MKLRVEGLFLLAVMAAASCAGRSKSPAAVTLGSGDPPVEPSAAVCAEGFAAIPGGGALRPFCLAKTEVTAAEYKACVASAQCTADGLRCDDAATYDRAESADHPINCVSWAQATKYCAAHGHRLPTETEWMWAARNGEQATTYPWGNIPPSDALLCFSGVTKRTGTCAVRSFAPNAFGVYDLAGSVSEWTSTVSLQPEEHAATLGGAWLYAAPYVVRADVHFESDTRVHDSVLGFRCAMSLSK